MIGDTAIYCNDRTYAEHCAWIDSLSENETFVLHAPVGWRYTLVLISLIKRYLTFEIPTNFRLEYLDWLDRQSPEWSAETIAAIQPMCGAGYEMVSEARKLGWKKMLDVVAEWKVFNAFVALNPSLLDAIKRRSPKSRYLSRAGGTKHDH